MTLCFFEISTLTIIIYVFQDLSLDSNIWGQCELFENIDLTAIQLQKTHQPKAPNHNHDGIKEDSKKNCVNLNSRDDDLTLKLHHEGEGSNTTGGNESLKLT